MQKIYDAADILEAHIVAGLLEQHDIQANVGGYYLQGGIGELPVAGNATVWIDAADLPQAQAIIRGYKNGEFDSPDEDSRFVASVADKGEDQ